VSHQRWSIELNEIGTVMMCFLYYDMYVDEIRESVNMYYDEIQESTNMYFDEI
jgi:hypothetical protein